MENNKITFHKRPIPILAEYRPMYQIAIVVLVLKYCCRGNTAGLQKLHLFSWCLSSENNMTTFKTLFENEFKNKMPHWTISPTLNRALNYALADNICELTTNHKYKLTLKGIDFANKIVANGDLFIHEKAFMVEIGKQITDEMVEKLTLKIR